MGRQLVLMVSVGLALLACSRRGDARARPNSVRTVILREGHAPPTNRSSWEPVLDPTVFQCISDLDCSQGSFCHVTARSPAHSRCQACHRRNRRCHRDGMCCPGNRCSINVCVPDVDGLKRRWRKRERGSRKSSSSEGRLGVPCLRSSDCSDGLCCARHFWTRICKPVLMEGQVCTRQRRKGHQGLELFQRCSCGSGLDCRTLRDSRVQLPSPSSSSLLSAASSSSSSSVNTRLHVCQKV